MNQVTSHTVTNPWVTAALYRESYDATNQNKVTITFRPDKTYNYGARNYRR